ncbi:MAG TPA: protoporphyrinogen oxidase [Opitutaceae bacterium]|nr:protoporphyrinogen oxidase [Opitutaceae bacterium]
MNTSLDPGHPSPSTSRHNSASRIAVLGAGITGLTAAWHLRRAGFSPIVLEKSPYVGGVIGTLQRGGWLHEHGPNSLMEGSPDLATFIHEIGLDGRRIYAAPAAKQRYVVRGGQLVAMPSSPRTFVATRLFSWRAKLWLAGEPLRRRADPNREESVADFVLRRLGREFLDYAVDPFVGGVYAGDPARLSLRHAFPKLHALEQEHGSLIRGSLKRRNASGGPKGRLFSFPNGLGELPAAIAFALGDAVQLQTKATAIRRTGCNWEIDCENGLRSWTEECAAVVCALPAEALASLKIEGVPEARRLAALREIEHPPLASVFTGFRRDDVGHPLDGFGVLIPQVEHSPILGTLFSSSLFAGRAPAGHVALTSFIGGTRQPGLLKLDDWELLRLIQPELERLFRIRGLPVFTHVQRWPRAIPQYTLGYQRFKDAMAAVEASAPGFFIGGNCRDGIALGNCIESGRRLANVAAESLRAWHA